MAKAVAVHEYADTQRDGYNQPKSSNGAMVAIAAVVALVLGGAGGFFAGYQVAGGSDNAEQSNQRMGIKGGSGGMMGGGQLGMGGIGTVTAVDDTSITIEDQRTGDETTYTITSDTEVTGDSEAATASDINVGDTVMIQSDDDSDADTKTATRIGLNPSFGGRPGGSMQNFTGNSSSSSESSI